MSISNRTPRSADIAPGDLVRIGPDRCAPFTVLAVRGDKAWVRSPEDGSDHLALVDRCRKVAAQVAA